MHLTGKEGLKEKKLDRETAAAAAAGANGRKDQKARHVTSELPKDNNKQKTG